MTQNLLCYTHTPLGKDNYTIQSITKNSLLPLSECGQCQKSLGEDINKLIKSASDVQTTAGVVEGVQGQDVRLQNLAVQLNTSLVTLGLSNTEATSATEIVSNMTGTRDILVTAYNTLQSQVRIK